MNPPRLVIIDGVRTPFTKMGTDLARLGAEDLGRIAVSHLLTKTGREFAGHGTVNHSIEEYVRGGFWHTNTVENYFSIFKRGVSGVYHHVSQKHLKRYLCEFDFRYNERTALGISDIERTKKALKGIAGKRMTYRRPRGGGHPDTSLYA